MRSRLKHLELRLQRCRDGTDKIRAAYDEMLKLILFERLLSDEGMRRGDKKRIREVKGNW